MTETLFAYFLFQSCAFHLCRYYISSELGKYQKQLEDYEKDQKGRGVSESLKNLKEYKKTLLKDMEQLKLIDGYNDWREKESALLSDLVQRRFR